MPSLQEHVHQAAEMVRALGATLPRPFVSPTFLIAVFLGTGGERSAGWFGGLKSDGLHDVSPASQSAHVFGVSRGRLEMSEEKKKEKRASQTHHTALPTGSSDTIAVQRVLMTDSDVRTV